MYTIGINSVDIDDNIAKYTEKCSAILASTYSRDHHSPRNGTIVCVLFTTITFHAKSSPGNKPLILKPV